MSSNDGFERRAGLTIAVFAAVLAINDLLGGKYGDDEILGANERANAFAWYQSKSTKQALVQHQIETIRLLSAPQPVDPVDAAAPPPAPDLQEEQLKKWEKEVQRYAKEKKEILEGSAAVGPDGWALENDEGQFGRIIGANEWGNTLDRLKYAGDRFDLGSLFLQLTLVLGAVSIVAAEAKMKSRYYWAMVLMGLIGAAFSGWGVATAAEVPLPSWLPQ